MHTYEEIIEYLYNQLPVFSVAGASAYKPGLATAIALAEAFGNPHKAFPTIHIAGSNGKGSTSNMLASVLQEAGYRTGLYTSPHIFDFRERIRVNGEMIPKESVGDFVERYFENKLDCSPSFFELTTIMAFEFFKESNVDIAVIETGLGGRLDTTNIILPYVSVITNVSLDHTAQLGDTISQIASEKAGIIKPGVCAVIGNAGEDERKVFDKVAEKNRSHLVYACDNPLISQNGTDYEWIKDSGKKKEHVYCDLKGEFQLENINTVMHAVRQLNKCGLNIEDKHLRNGLSHVCSNTHFFGRWTTTKYEGINIIIDTGHNIGAWKWLAPQLQKISAVGNLHVVIGFVSDKQIDPIFELLPKNAVYHLVAPGIKRARDVEYLEMLAKRNNLHSYVYASVTEGYEKSLNLCHPGDTLFIGGSNYLVSEIPCSDMFECHEA